MNLTLHNSFELNNHKIQLAHVKDHAVGSYECLLQYKIKSSKCMTNVKIFFNTTVGLHRAKHNFTTMQGNISVVNKKKLPLKFHGIFFSPLL